jgi:hypothetical protein
MTKDDSANHLMQVSSDQNQLPYWKHPPLQQHNNNFQDSKSDLEALKNASMTNPEIAQLFTILQVNLIMTRSFRNPRQRYQRSGCKMERG